MAIFDVMMSFGSDKALKELRIVNKNTGIGNDVDTAQLLGKSMEFIFGCVEMEEEGFMEFCGRLYKYQSISNNGEHMVFLSSSSMLAYLYEHALDHTAEGIQIFDRNGYFLYGNSASERLECYRKEDFTHKHILDIYDYNSRDEYSSVLTALRTQDKVENRCDRFKVKDGKMLTTINSAYPAFIKGKVGGVIAFESDMALAEQLRNRMISLEGYMKSSTAKSRSRLYSFESIIFQSEKMKEAIHFAKKVSLMDSSILIEGDTGTGKELFAQSIHSYSTRRNKPFIDINCSAIPENLAESIFFGTEKGAFTGSLAKPGIFEMADGGTVFLDEVNSISLEMQAKLLRALQEKRIQRVGGGRYIECDIRLITATNENMDQLIQKQRIRKDFYYRISTVKLRIAPLHERREDIPVLVRHFVNELCKKYNRQPMDIDDEAMNLLVNAEWPGNVRELQNSVEYAFNMAYEGNNSLGYDNFPDYIKETGSSARAIRHVEPMDLRQEDKSFGGQLDAYESVLLEQVLEKNEWNITRSAKALGMSRQSLQYKIRKLKIEKTEIRAK